MKRLLCLLTAIVAAFCTATHAWADDIEDFYRGRQIRFISGYPAGTDYDRWARLFCDIGAAHSRQTDAPGRIYAGRRSDHRPTTFITGRRSRELLLMFEHSLPNAILLGDPNIK